MAVAVGGNDRGPSGEVLSQEEGERNGNAAGLELKGALCFPGGERGMRVIPRPGPAPSGEET